MDPSFHPLQHTRNRMRQLALNTKVLEKKMHCFPLLLVILKLVKKIKH